MPRPVEALPWGSRSITRVGAPTAASAVPRLMAVVVLPTPPFWLATTSTRRPGSGFVSTPQPPHTNDAPPGVALARQDIRLKIPIYCSFFQFGRNILSLEEQSYGATPQIGLGVAQEASK